MAYSYKVPNRDQLYLLPPSVSEWLPEDDLVWFILDVVKALDLSAFHARHPNDGVGRRAYDPELMVAIMLYAYCTGLRSSRRIAAACRRDLAFKAICCDVVPEHDAIGEFRVDHETALADVFRDVLALCAKAGLASLGTVSIDGTKIGADAALDQNRTESAINKEVAEMLAEAEAADAFEATQPTLSGSLPETLASPTGRLGRLKGALREIEVERAARQRVQDEKAANQDQAARAGIRPRGRVPKAPAMVKERAEAELVAAQARLDSATTALARLDAIELRTRAERQLAEAEALLAASCPPKEPEANTTDPQSRIMKTQTGWVQGFNAQAAVNEHQVVVAALVTNEANDVGQLLPVIEAMEMTAQAAGITEQVGTVLADAGYWSEANATAEGPDRLIATTKDWKQRKAAREMGTTTGQPPKGASSLEQMEHRLRTKEGAAAYAKRSTTVEPVFGQAKENRGVRRFTRRGLVAVNSEWQLVCATGNIMKLFSLANGRSLAQTLNGAI